MRIGRPLQGLLATAALIAGPLGRPAPAKEDRIKLPGPAESLAIAGSGRYLLVKCAGQPGLSLYDAQDGSLKAVEVGATRDGFAAGGDVAVIYSRDTGVIRSVDLKTRKTIKTAELLDAKKKPLPIGRIAMGAARGDRAVLWIDDLDAGGLAELNVATLKLTRVKGSAGMKPVEIPEPMIGTRREIREMKGPPPPVAEIPTDPSLSCAVACLRNSPVQYASRPKSGGALALRPEVPDGRLLYGAEIGHTSPGGYFALGADGRVYTAWGYFGPQEKFFRPRDTPATGAPRRVPSASLVPALDGGLFAAVYFDGRVNVLSGENGEAIGALDPFPDWGPPKGDSEIEQQTLGRETLPPGAHREVRRTGLGLDRRIVLAPKLGHVLYLTLDNKTVVRRDFDPKALRRVNTSGESFRVASAARDSALAGAAYGYSIVVAGARGKVTYKLLESPPGMTISPTGKLAWKAPAGRVAPAKVKVEIADESGEPIVHEFSIRMIR